MVNFTEFTEARIWKWCPLNCVNSGQTPNWQKKDDIPFSEDFGLNNKNKKFGRLIPHDSPHPYIRPPRPHRAGQDTHTGGGPLLHCSALLTCSPVQCRLVNGVSSRSGLTVWGGGGPLLHSASAVLGLVDLSLVDRPMGGDALTPSPPSFLSPPYIPPPPPPSYSPKHVVGTCAY